MAYTVGSLIEAADYNGFVSTTSGANLNDIWGTGSGDKGWGQTALGTVATGGIISATNWASLVNNLSTAGSQTNTALTSRSAPQTGDTVAILASMNTDLTNVTTNRGYASASGATSTTWSGNVSMTNTTPSTGGWSQTWTQTVTFDSANAARYFWNAGGLVRIDMSKTSTGAAKDAAWNTFVSQVGTIYISGRVNSAAQVIAGTSYTGTTRVGGSGTPYTLLFTYGWYTVASGTSWQVFRLDNALNGDRITIDMGVNIARTELTLTISWLDVGVGGATSGGTATTSPFTGTYGTAPTVLCRVVPPSSSYLTNTWGSQTVASTLSNVFGDYLIVASGGGGGGSDGSGYSGGGGGAGGLLQDAFQIAFSTGLGVQVGTLGPRASQGNPSTFYSRTATGGGAGGNNSPGGSGGSGGGSGDPFGSSGTGGAGTPGQGYPGVGKVPSGSEGSGGGAGGAAYTPNSGVNTVPGPGLYVSWALQKGSPLGYYAGGGAGGAQGLGGIGGGGYGGGNSPGGSGDSYTGGGGGGAHGISGGLGGFGGSGIVVLRVPSTVTGTFSAGITGTVDTSQPGYKIYYITGTSTAYEYITFTQ